MIVCLTLLFLIPWRHRILSTPPEDRHLTPHASPLTPHPEDFFVPLAIFTEIRPEHRLAQEEIFGPVLAVMKVKDFEEALTVANGTQYALTGAVFSRSPVNIARAQEEFRVGNLYINRGCTGALVERHPFGGFKLSGIGSKTGGPDYLRQFMTPRSIVENTLRRGFAPPEEYRTVDKGLSSVGEDAELF